MYFTHIPGVVKDEIGGVILAKFSVVHDSDVIVYVNRYYCFFVLGCIILVHKLGLEFFMDLEK